jgi:anti-sigma factor RsiW
MDCAKAKKIMSRAIDDELDSGLFHTLETHLNSCDGCLRAYMDMKALDSRTRELGEILKKSDQDLAKLIGPAIQRRVEKDTNTEPVWLRRAVFASIALVAILIGASLGQVFSHIMWQRSPVNQEVSLLIPTEDISVASTMVSLPEVLSEP